MRWGKRPTWFRTTPPEVQADQGARGPVDDWLVIPFKYAEPARVSLWNLANRPDMPEHIAMEIAEWLVRYNSHVTAYFREEYGEQVFDDLKEITLRVQAAGDREASWDRWEDELRDR